MQLAGRHKRTTHTHTHTHIRRDKITVHAWRGGSRAIVHIGASRVSPLK